MTRSIGYPRGAMLDQLLLSHLNELRPPRGYRRLFRVVQLHLCGPRAFGQVGLPREILAPEGESKGELSLDGLQIG